MEEPLEQEHSMTNDDIKPSSSSSTTTKLSRSTKQTTTNGTTRRHKRRRQTNSTRSSSDHSTSSSRSSSSSSIHSSHSSIKNFTNTNDQELKKTRSCLAQEHLQKILDKTKTGKYDILDSFSFLSFETDEDWRIAFEHFNQQQLQQSYTTKKSSLLTGGKKNGNLTEHTDGQLLNRSISVPCKTEDGHRTHNTPTSAPVDDTSIENHRSSMWQTLSPNKIPHDFQSLTTIKSEPIDKSNRLSRTTSEQDENHFDPEYNQNSITISSEKSNDDPKIETTEKKHHHHHHHHHHKSHKRHKTKHDLSVNGDSSNKHPTITSMSDLAKQHIKSEPMSLPPSFNFPPHFDPKLFPLPSFSPFAPHHQQSSPFPGAYDHQLMLASRLYGNQYPRDIPMPRPPSRSLQHPFFFKDNHPESTSMEKMFEKFYPGVLPSYLAAAAAAATRNSNSPVSSLNVKMHGASPNAPDHSVWPHRETFQRQFLAASNKRSSTKSPLFDPNPKLSSNHPGQSPTDHHHRRHSSSTTNPDLPNATTPTGHPLYLAPVIVTEFHQHQHNHNHTHEHKLNITTKEDRQSSPRSKTPLSNENKKSKSSFSVSDMFIDKTPSIKHSPQQQGFLSVIHKKDSNTTNLQLKKPSNGKWSTAHVHIAWMIYHHEQRQRDKLNLHNPSSKVRPSNTLIPPQPTLLPPPLPLIDNNNHDLSLLRPPPPPPPFAFPFELNSQQNPLFRSPSTSKLPRPTVTLSSSSIKTPTIKREQKTPFIDERIRRTSSPPLSRPTSGSNFLPSSPSHRMRMDFPSLLLPPPQHQSPSFFLNDDRKRFMTPNADFLPPGSSQFLSSLFPMGAPPILPPPPPPPSSMSSSSSRRSSVHPMANSDSSKSSLFPLPPSSPFDFTRSPLLPPGLSLSNNHLDSDRYRFILEQQARERDFQFAMMAAASTGNAPPPLFTDPNAAALFKPY